MAKFLAAPADYGGQFHEMFLAVDASYEAAKRNKNAPASMDREDYELRVDGLIANLLRADDRAAIESAVMKISYLGGHVPGLCDTIGDLRRLEPLSSERRAIALLESGMKALASGADEEPIATRPSVDAREMAQRRRSYRELAQHALDRRRLEATSPSCRRNAETISFALERPGLSLHVEHGPYNGLSAAGPDFKNFWLSYDPKRFPRWSVVRRALGDQPQLLDANDLRRFGESYLAEDGPQLELHLKDRRFPPGSEEREKNGPLLLISRNTGQVRFFPRGYAADDRSSLPLIAKMILTDLQNMGRQLMRGIWTAE
ncbi:MAG: hypothetical protein KGJ45_00250 [Elusimicrobia bacterium]|nr:hypothetical protein [Elusimicrobiota bacterium]